MYRRKISLFILLLFITACSSNYHASYGSRPKPKEQLQISINTIAIGSVSSSDFWKVWQREYFKDALKDELYKQGKVRIVRGGSLYRINIDIYDNSGKAKKKMGKFLGKKQYRIVQDYNIRAWYRIEKRGAKKTLRQGTATYIPYTNMASTISFKDAEKKVIKKKLQGIAEEVAGEVLRYFTLNK